MKTRDELNEKYATLMPHLDERQKRLVVAADARMLGGRSVSRVARAAGLSRPTVYRGMEELATGGLTKGRTREPGGGRKALAEKNPRMMEMLEALVAPATSGDPMSPLRWTCKSTRKLAEELGHKGCTASHMTVAEALRSLGYSLQANVKTIEGTEHPDRDAQFGHISRAVGRLLREGQPVISVDTKKKELVGRYKNAGQTWRPAGDPETVKCHDFIDPAVGKAIPYGVYDIGTDQGWVNVGCDADTAAFAVASIRSWWKRMGKRCYPHARELLVTADSGGSNGYRTRLWKVELQRLADELGLDIGVCHFPPGTSKWNKIEHRLFSHISMNWRGQPLVSHEVVVSLIGATTTSSGLRVKARLDRRTYPTKVRVSDEDMASIDLVPHAFHGDWNYIIKHRPKPSVV